MTCPCCSTNCCDLFSEIEIEISGTTPPVGECAISDGIYAGSKNILNVIGPDPITPPYTQITYLVKCEEEKFVSGPNAGKTTGQLLFTASISFWCSQPIGSGLFSYCRYSFARSANNPFTVSCSDRSAVPSVVEFSCDSLTLSDISCGANSPPSIVIARAFRI